MEEDTVRLRQKALQWEGGEGHLPDPCRSAPAPHPGQLDYCGGGGASKAEAGTGHPQYTWDLETATLVFNKHPFNGSPGMVLGIRAQQGPKQTLTGCLEEWGHPEKRGARGCLCRPPTPCPPPRPRVAGVQSPCALCSLETHSAEGLCK